MNDRQTVARPAHLFPASRPEARARPNSRSTRRRAAGAGAARLEQGLGLQVGCGRSGSSASSRPLCKRELWQKSGGGARAAARRRALAAAKWLATGRIGDGERGSRRGRTRADDSQKAVRVAKSYSSMSMSIIHSGQFSIYEQYRIDAQMEMV